MLPSDKQPDCSLGGAAGKHAGRQMEKCAQKMLAKMSPPLLVVNNNGGNNSLDNNRHNGGDNNNNNNNINSDQTGRAGR